MPSSRLATTRETSAIRGSRARRTATSLRRSAATRIWSSTARSFASWASPTIRFPKTWRPPRTGPRSGTEFASVEYKADEICLAWLLERRLFEEGWEAEFDGEIVGAIGSGIFVRFDAVFEGYVPARKLPGDYYELNPLATALVGRRSGFAYRLGTRSGFKSRESKNRAVESVSSLSGKP